MKVQGTVTSKKGFYVGDPCYVLSEDNYDGVFGANDYQDGQYTGKTLNDEEFNFILAGTKYGDGEYYDNRGNTYGVDAGILGVVPIELCLKDNKEMSIEELDRLGKYFPGTEAEFEAGDGIFYITIGSTDLVIDTDEEDWDDYDDEDEWDETYSEDDDAWF